MPPVHRKTSREPHPAALPLELIELAPPPVGVALERLDPRRLSQATEDAARELVRQGTSANTLASYQAAMRYWAAWFNVRYGQPITLPLPPSAVLQFIVDHAQRTTRSSRCGDRLFGTG